MRYIIGVYFYIFCIFLYYFCNKTTPEIIKIKMTCPQLLRQFRSHLSQGPSYIFRTVVKRFLSPIKLLNFNFIVQNRPRKSMYKKYPTLQGHSNTPHNPYKSPLFTHYLAYQIFTVYFTNEMFSILYLSE